MIEKIIKAVKRGNKRRGRNITIGAVIGFLLSCTAVMGADSYLWIKEDGGIKFNTTGDNGKWNEKNPYENAGNIWDTGTKTYTNNIELSSNAANGKNSSGRNISYGLRLSGELTDVNFINNGSITGIMNSTSSSIGYGIYNEASKMGNITNTGIVSGTGKGNSSDNSRGIGKGIYNDLVTMENIVNIGIISGSGSGINDGTGDGSGIENYQSTIGAVTNTGVISGTGKGDNTGAGSGYGIFNYNSATIGAITNEGVISGTGTSSDDDGEGYGIYNSSSTMGAITNEGVISGSGISTTGNGEGYGIYNGAKMGDIENTGLISGAGEGYGIINYSTSTPNYFSIYFYRFICNKISKFMVINNL